LHQTGLSEDTACFYEVLNDEPEFVQVIVGAAYIDACLGAMLQRFLLESSVSEKLLDARGGALGSLAARADMCYSLGLIKKELYADLTKIAEIRNTFAHHHLTLDFGDPQVAALCEQLGYIDSLRNSGTGQPAFGEMIETSTGSVRDDVSSGEYAASGGRLGPPAQIRSRLT
jgi:DNA-binding MltR family transcriptional regulator